MEDRIVQKEDDDIMMMKIKKAEKRGKPFVDEVSRLLRYQRSGMPMDAPAMLTPLYKLHM